MGRNVGELVCGGADERRAVAHKIYGVPQTINSANYVYFLAYQELQRIHPFRPDYKIEEAVTRAASPPFAHLQLS